MSSQVAGNAAAQPVVIPNPAKSDINQQMRTRVPKYLCGDCGEETFLKANEHVRCRHCGYRILYKARLEETVMEYTAR